MAPHAVFSPSGAYRWLACPGSVRLSKGLYDPGNVWAAEGTAAHALAEFCLRTRVDPGEFQGLWIDIDGGMWNQRPATLPAGRAFPVDTEMVAGVGLYLATVREREEKLESPIRYVEQTVHFDSDCWGTCDCIIVQPGEHLEIWDLKFGKGFVDVEQNHQLMIYAIAAILTLCGGDAPPLITTGIVQPRSRKPPVRMRTYRRDELIPAFMDQLASGIAAAQRDDAPTVKGDHCQWCKALNVCPEWC